MGHQTKWLAVAAASMTCFILWGGDVKNAQPAWAAESPAPASASGLAAAVVPYKTLTWDDFRVSNAPQGGAAADTEIALSYRSRMRAEETKNTATCAAGEAPVSSYTAHISGITFTGGFDRLHSWRRSDVLAHPDANRLLLHEQGHMDIAEIGRRRLAALPLSAFPEGHGATMTAAVQDLQSKMTVWFNAESARIQSRQTQYDNETEHSIKKNAQQTWNDVLTREIAATNPPSSPEMLAAAR